MTIEELPSALSSVLVRHSERSLYDTAIRIKSGIDPAAVLSSLCKSLLPVSNELGSPIYLSVEPNGDACDTGHWVDVEVHTGIVWAEMTPWPQRFGGTVPTYVDAELSLDGWVAISDARSGPLCDQCTTPPGELAALTQPSDISGVMRRLVADVGDDDLRDWADLVSRGVQRVIGPNARRWYLHASIEVLDAGPLNDPPYATTEFDGAWSIDLGQLLHHQDWERAIWDPESEAGSICCRLGLHRYHRPPCAPLQGWADRPEEGGKDADMDV